MPEVLEPPAPPESQQADSDALKASFNTALKEQQALAPETTADETPPADARPTLIPNKPKVQPKKTADEIKDEPLVPDEFIEKPKAKVDEPPPADEIPANAPAKQLRDVLARRDVKIKEQADRIAELQRKSETTAPNKEQEEAYKSAIERAAKLEEQLERAAFAESPKFKRFETEAAAELTSAKSYLEGTDISPSILDAAEHASGQARLKLLREAGMDAETIAAIGPHLARADAIRRDRDASLANWKSGLASDQEQQQAQKVRDESRRLADEQSVFKAVGEKMKATLEAFQPVDGHEKWNAMVEQNWKDAAEFFAGQKPLEQLAELAYLGVSARTTRIMNETLRKKLDAANEELSRLRAVQPETGKPADAKNGSAEPKSDTEHYKSTFNAEMAKVRPA